MSDLISRKALLEEIESASVQVREIEDKKLLTIDLYDAIKLITNAPTIQREGWVSVPIEPTHDMLYASLDKFDEGGTYLVYKTMIQAAPTNRS